jgi:hypothetical protein
MSALSIQPTFPIFTDIDGQPLENGYIWIGVANLDPQVNPINVYWDSALTISAPQPIRTLGGYPSRNGTPARLYVNSDYSIRVQNRNGSTVYSAQAAAERYSSDLISFTGFKGQVGVVADLADDDGANWIGFDPAGASSIARSAQEKMRDFVSVKDYGAVGDGVANDGPAINACFADPLVGAVYFPKGTYLTNVQILNNRKPARGEGWQITTIKASAAIQSVFQLSGQNCVVEQIFFDGNNLTDYGVIMRQCNSSILQNFGVENVKVDGVYYPKQNNNNTAAVKDGLIRYVGTTYSTGTASVSAGGTVVTITGAADLTTLGFRVTDDFLKVGTTQRAREIVSITSNTVTVYPAFNGAETSVSYSLRKGSGIHIDTHGDNSRQLIEQNTMQFCAVAGLDQTPLYGATCIRNTVEFCEFGHIIGRRSISSATRGSEDIGPYYEGNPSGDWLVGGAIGFDIISPNSDVNLDKLVFQPNQGPSVRIRLAQYDLTEYTEDQTNLTTINPQINTTQYIAGAQNCVVNLPDVPANTSSGAGYIYIWHVRLVVRTKSGFNTTIKSSTFVNGVAGATGVVVTGDYKVYDCYYQPGAGWVVQV